MAALSLSLRAERQRVICWLLAAPPSHTPAHNLPVSIVGNASCHLDIPATRPNCEVEENVLRMVKGPTRASRSVLRNVRCVQDAVNIKANLPGLPLHRKQMEIVGNFFPFGSE